MIIVKNLIKKYGDNIAVNNISFSLKEGKIYGLLGPNGAGKSTTMNMLTGYLTPTEGEIFIDGHNIDTEPVLAKACIGYLPEIPPLYVDMTVKEYLYTAAELKKVSKNDIKAMVDDAMERVKITNMSNRLIKNLSKGYKQRVGIAQAMLGYPKIIILDEPTVGLDPKQIIDIRELIKELGKNHTVILSSHILTEVSEVCDEVLIINKGQLMMVSPTSELEKRFTDNGQLEFVVDIKEESIRKILGSMEDITSYTINPDEVEAGAFKVMLRLGNNKDIRRVLFTEIANNDGIILEMRKHHMSLEDVFLEITQN